MFVAIVFQGQVYISDETRQLFFYVMVSVCLIGSASLLLLRPLRPVIEDENSPLEPLLKTNHKKQETLKDETSTKYDSIFRKLDTSDFRSLRRRSLRNAENEIMDDGTVETELAAQTVVPPPTPSPWESFGKSKQVSTCLKAFFTFLFCAIGSYCGELAARTANAAIVLGLLRDWYLQHLR